MTTLPYGEPNVIPAGTYTATIRGEVAERTSKFDPARIYYALPLRLENQAGEGWDFSWFFSPRSPVYIRCLEIIGGVVSPSGKIAPPNNYEGKKFQIKIGEKPSSKDSSRMVNAVLSIWSDTSPSKEKFPSADDDDIETPF